MQKRTKLQNLKRFIKIGIAVGLLVVLIVLGVFVKSKQTFENSNTKKWLNLSPTQQIDTVHKVVSDVDDMDLLLDCVTKIANLPDSDTMDIRDAVALCYNGIKMSIETLPEGLEKNDAKEE